MHTYILEGVPSTPACYRVTISFPRLLWFGGCATHVTPCSVPGYSYFTKCSEKSEHNCLTSYRYKAAILASFCFIRVFKEVLSSEFVQLEQKHNNCNQQKTRLEASKLPAVFTPALMVLIINCLCAYLLKCT